MGEVSLSYGSGGTSEPYQGQQERPSFAEFPGREHNDHPPPFSSPLADVAEDVRGLASGFAPAQQLATGAAASFAGTKSRDDEASGGADAGRCDGDGGGGGVEIFFFSSCSVSDESQLAAAASSPRKPASAISGLPPAWHRSRSPPAVPPSMSSTGFALPSATSLGPRQLQMRLAKRMGSLDLFPLASSASSASLAPQSSSVTSASSASLVSTLSPLSLHSTLLQEAAAAGDQVATTEGAERLRVASGVLGEGSEDSARSCDAEMRVQLEDAAVAPPPDVAGTCADAAPAAISARGDGVVTPNSRKVRLSLDSAAPQERNSSAEKAAGSRAPLKSALKGSSKLGSSEKRKQLRPRLSLDSSGRAAAASATSKVKEGKEMRSVSFPVSSLASLPEPATHAALSPASAAEGGDSSCHLPSPTSSSPLPHTALVREAAQKPKSILVKYEEGGKGKSSGGKVRFQKTVDVIVFA